SGFAETFSQYVVEVAPGGGSDRPETEQGVEAALFVVDGQLSLVIDGENHVLSPGGFAYVPPSARWTLRNSGAAPARFHWFRKAYEAVEGLGEPEAHIASDREIAPDPMPDTQGRWATTRFMDPADLRHDMHITIVTLEPGAV